MTYETINDARTISGSGGGGAILAGRYRVVRQLGQGGMGSVWLAEDTQLDNKPFAIKMLPSLLVSNRRAYRQLKDEALVAMKLTHPNIVTLRAFEENNGNPFLVMDYVDGQTLEDYLAEKGKLSEDEVQRVLRPIAVALDYAHTKGVVHRDVKPGNVMIAKDGTSYILDFGIAREIQETMTRVTGKFASGTLLYMSPEQLRGAPPRAAQDVYSFAAMVYECLKGEPPFSRGQVEFQILSEPPPPLSSAVAEVGGSFMAGHCCIRASLVASVMAGLAKKPHGRPQNCVAVLNGGELQHSTARTQGVVANNRVETAGRRFSNTPKADGANFAFATKMVAAMVLLAVLAGGIYLFRIGYSSWMRNRERVKAQESATRTEEIRSGREDVVRTTEQNRNAHKDQQRTDEEAERALLVKLRVDIGERVGDARQKIGQISAYRSDPEGFQEHIDTADRNWKIANGVDRTPQTVDEARLALTQASEALSAIESELQWLKANKGNRDVAKAVEGAIVRDIVPELVRFNASDCVGSIYGEGEKLRREGNAALSNGDFQTARVKLYSAKEKLSKAAAAAKKSCIDKHFRLAEKHYRDSLWEECTNECGMVLGWDSSNEKAKRLKEDAENRLVPSAEIVIFVEGDKVPLGSGETVKIGNKPCTTPIKWGEDDIKKGMPYGSRRVSYERGGRRYSGKLEAFTVNWDGLKRMRVYMTEEAGNVVQHGEKKTFTLPGGATMEMIYVGPGSFIMGSPAYELGRHRSDEMQRRATLANGFWLGKYEVTQRQWESVMGYNPSRFKGDNRPVENVTWEECQKFIQRVNSRFNCGARLPTEAEWEYACRAESTGAYAGTGSLDDMGWYSGNSGGVTHDVGLKGANGWGFCDMHGNVYEYCENKYNAFGDYRMLRGGSWNSKANFCRSAFRNRDRPDYLHGRDGNGFRLCCSTLPNE